MRKDASHLMQCSASRSEEPVIKDDAVDEERNRRVARRLRSFWTAG